MAAQDILNVNSLLGNCQKKRKSSIINLMFIVEFYKSPNGKEVVKKTYFEYSDKQRAKIAKSMANLKEYGINQAIANLRKLLGTHLWEYRILGKDNIRIICVSLPSNRIMVLHIFTKKSQKTSTKDLKTSIAVETFLP